MMVMAARLKHTRILMTAMCLLETKELASVLSLSESFYGLTTIRVFYAVAWTSGVFYPFYITLASLN